MAQGSDSTVVGNQSIAIGTGQEVYGSNSGAIGDPNVLAAERSYVIGNLNTVGDKNDIQADSDSSAIALEYGIDPYIRRVNPIVDLKIEDAHNSDELAKVFESLKNNVKKELYIHCLISVAIGLSVFIVSCALFVLINNKLRNKHMVQYTVLLGLVVICVFLSVGWIIYMGRAF